MCNAARGRRLSQNEEMINSILMNAMHRMMLLVTSLMVDILTMRLRTQRFKIIHLIIMIEMSYLL